MIASANHVEPRRTTFKPCRTTSKPPPNNFRTTSKPPPNNFQTTFKPHRTTTARYDKFTIPKPSGGKRKIENPIEPLKKIQQKLGFYLQALYSDLKPDCAYGFIRTAEDENDYKDIYTNALQHINSKWLINVDLKDFFHSFLQEQVRLFFRQAPLRFSPEAAEVLAHLTTYNGRLPMGAPTSPVLSNLLSLPLDAELMQLAEKHNWIYTRYADDMTFSTQQKFKKDQIREIRKTIQNAGFRINEDKWKKYKTINQPEVTGLILKKKKPDLKKSFIRSLERDIEVYEYLLDPAQRNRFRFPPETMKKMRQSIIGQINFVGFVKGDHHKKYHQLRARMKLSNRLER